MWKLLDFTANIFLQKFRESNLERYHAQKIWWNQFFSKDIDLTEKNMYFYVKIMIAFLHYFSTCTVYTV